MGDYHIYHMGDGTKIISRRDFVCADDKEAVQKAQSLITDRDVEVWERARFVVRLKASEKG
jgi:hypothetical protein